LNYEVVTSARARRDIAALSEKAATAVLEFLAGPLAENPHRVGKALKLQLEGRHVARRGDYRVVYRIDDDRRRIEVSHVEHRRTIYRTR